MFHALVVDDDPHVCALAARALARRNFQCVMASDGDQALRIFDQGPFDVVLTDLRMPRRHGHALATELLQRNPRPRIVVLTGLAEPRLVEDLVRRGVDQVVQKPINFDGLADTIARLVAENHTQLEHASRTVVDPVKSQFEQLRAVEGKLLEISRSYGERLIGLFDSGALLHGPPPAVQDFISRQAEIEEAAEASAAKKKTAHEMRGNSRVRCHATAIAMPVNNDFAPQGEACSLAVRDVSESGARLLHTRATTAKFLALSWSAETQPLERIAVVSKLMRCRPLSPFYDIGCQFLPTDV